MAYYRHCGASNGRQCVQYDDDLFDGSPIHPAPPTQIPYVPSTKRSRSAQSPSPMPKIIRVAVNNRKQDSGRNLMVHAENGQVHETQFASKLANVAPTVPPSNGVRASADACRSEASGSGDDEGEQWPQHLMPSCKYTKHELIGKGSYGTVRMGKNLENDQIVAIKTMSCRTDAGNANIHYVAQREVQALRHLKHENVISLLDVMRFNDKTDQAAYDLDLIFEYCRFELTKIIANRKIELRLADIKNLLCQLFTGLDYIHQQCVMHRDLKTENILLTSAGVLKIADFGWARPVPAAKNGCTTVASGSDVALTVPAVTLWYRPPELLLGAKKYTTAIDLWSAGCVMAEFWTRKPILQGSTEKTQIMNVLNLCGSISLNDWPDAKDLPVYQNVHLPRTYKRNVQQRLKPYTTNEKAIELVNDLLTLNPAKRIKCGEVLNHVFFFSAPVQSDLEEFMAKLRQARWY